MVQTKIKIDSESDFTRSVVLIEQPSELQIQVEQQGDEAFVDLQIPEAMDLHKQLGHYLTTVKAIPEQQTWQPAAKPPAWGFPILLWCFNKVTRTGWYENGKYWTHTDTGYREENFVMRWLKIQTPKT